mgnify:CR=1 FL=1
MTDQIDVGARWRSPRKRWRRNASVAVGIGVLALTGCGPYQKAKLDREVDRLCAIDGGVHIYETVKLPKENFGPDGEVFPQYRAHVVTGDGFGPNYKWTSVTKWIVEGDPSLVRWEQTITRMMDGKVLGKRIVYVRGGGDLPGPWAPSGYSCRNVSIDLTQQVFLRGDSK